MSPHPPTLPATATEPVKPYVSYRDRFGPKTSGSTQPEPGKCGARLRGSDKYCRKPPMRGRRRCKLHGGKSLRGADLPQTKYAFLPPSVQQRFQESLADKGLTDLRPDVALLDVLKQEAASGIEAGVSAQQWTKACEAFLAVQKAQTKVEFRRAMQALGELLVVGTKQAEAREETARMVERKAKVVKVLHQMQVETEELIPAKRIGLALAMVAALVRKYVQEEAQRRAFSQEFVALIGPRLKGEVVDGEEVAHAEST